jgi:chromosome segregation ATPase
MTQTESLSDTDDSDDLLPLNPSDSSSLGRSSSFGDSHSEMPVGNDLLVSELQHLNDQVDAKWAELDNINAELNSGLDRFKDEIAKEERKRDELSAEVNQMKLMIHLLATDLHNNKDTDGRKGFPSIFSSASAESWTSSSGDVEMKTIRSFYQQSSTGTIQELEKELERERSRLEGCVQKRNEWREQVEQLSTVNQLLGQDNDRLQAEKEDIEELTHEIERLREENDQVLSVQEKDDSDHGVEQLTDEVERLRQEKRKTSNQNRLGRF